MNLKTTISEDIIINRDIDWLFGFSQNINERRKWDKQTLEINFLDDFTELQKGARVYTKSIEGIRMDTEYLTFESPNEISIKMLNESPVFKSFVGSWNYSKIENSRTKLKISYQFNLRFPYNLIPKKVSRKIKVNIAKKLCLLDSYVNEKNDQQ